MVTLFVHVGYPDLRDEATQTQLNVRQVQAADRHLNTR